MSITPINKKKIEKDKKEHEARRWFLKIALIALIVSIVYNVFFGV